MVHAAVNTEENAGPPSHTMLEALCFIARHHGLHLSQEQLIRQFARSHGEVSAASIVAAADQNGLKAQRTHLRFEHLLRLGRAVPALLRMKDGTAQVLINAHVQSSPPVVLLRHPTDGSQPQPYDLVSLSEIWDGEAILFKRKHGTSQAEEDFSIGWLIRQLAKDKRIFRDVGFSALAMSFFALVPPLLYFLVVNRVLVHQRMSTLFVLAVGVGFVVIFDAIFGYLRRWLVAEGTARIDARLGTYIFDRLVGLPLRYSNGNPRA